MHVQARVDRVILAIKSEPDRGVAVALWRDLVAQLERGGADTILLACTDLNAVSATAPTALAVVDATRSLAAATVREWLKISRGTDNQ